MSYFRLYDHVVWTTKQRAPLLTPQIENSVYDLLRRKAIGLGGIVFALNGVADHVHLVASIPPRIAVARSVGQVKATASAQFNQLGCSDGSLFWQKEYGVFSLDAKRLTNFLAYVQRQQEHHLKNTTIPALERSNQPKVKSARESLPPFAVEEAGWLREMKSQGDLAKDYPVQFSAKAGDRDCEGQMRSRDSAF